MRAKADKLETTESKNIEIEEPTVEQKKYKKTWAILIRQVWEINPLICPKCFHEMKVISVINDYSVIKKILEHLGLWEEDEKNKDPPDLNDIIYEPFQDDWNNGEAVNY